MASSRSCPRCRGYMQNNRDIYGEYRECLQCGYMEDPPSPGNREVSFVPVSEKEVA